MNGGQRMEQNQNKDDYIEIDLLRVLQTMWHRAWAIILVMLLCGGAAFSVAKFLITPTYKASALMYVNNSSISVGSTSINLSDLSASKSLVDTYIIILKTRLTLEEVIDQANLSYTYEELYEMVDAAAVNSTEIFEITVVSVDPVEAKNIANTIVDVLPDKISEIIDGSSVRAVDFAVVPNKKDAPSITKYTALGLLLGFLLSCGMIVLAVMFDDQIHDEDYLTDTYKLPVLAMIPELYKSRKGWRRDYEVYHVIDESDEPL